MQEIRQKYYFATITESVRKGVKECQTFVQGKKIDNSQSTPEHISKPEWDLGLEDVTQIDLLPEVPPSGGFEKGITAIDVFFTKRHRSRGIQPCFRYHRKHYHRYHDQTCYLLTLMITDRSSIFVSNKINELAEFLATHTTMQQHSIHKLSES